MGLWIFIKVTKCRNVTIFLIFSGLGSDIFVYSCICDFKPKFGANSLKINELAERIKASKKWCKYFIINKIRVNA